MDRTELGDRMKSYERREAGRRCMPRLPICARIDGKRFSVFTRGLARPYDERLSRLMVDVTTHLVRETGACVGYTQSDEISLVFYSPSERAQVYLDGRIQKLVSILASMTTARFAAMLADTIPEKAETPALFDARVWTVPTQVEACNVLLWRELDATKNSISMAAQTEYSHAELHGKSGSQQQDLLHARGINWNDYPAFFKRGTYVQRRMVTRRFNADELARLPAQHAARSNPDLEVSRSVVTAVEMPPLGTVTNREAVVFEGAAPEVASSPE